MGSRSLACSCAGCACKQCSRESTARCLARHLIDIDSTGLGRSSMVDEHRASAPRRTLYIVFSAIAFLFTWSLSKLRAPLQESQGKNRTESPVRVVVDSLPPAARPSNEQKSRKEWKNRRESGWAAVQVLTLFGLVAYVRQIKRATDLTQQALNQRRPWIGIPEITLTDQQKMGSRTRPTLEWRMSITLKNYGDSPAQRIFINSGNIQVGRAMMVGGSWKKLGLCGGAEDASRGTGPAETIFPGSEGTDKPFGMSVQHEAALTPGPKWAVFCVAYQEMSGKMHHAAALFFAVAKDTKQAIPAPNTPNLIYFPTDHFQLRDTDTDEN
jgi:hypothetical protein